MILCGMLDLCRIIFWIVVDLIRPRAALEAEILVLRQQIIVLRRGRPRRLSFLTVDKVFLGWVYHLFPKARDALAIVKPDTVIRWHGAGFRFFLFIAPEIVGKWINLLSDVKPDLSRVALMFNPDTSPYYDAYLRSFKALPQQSSFAVSPSLVRSVTEIEAAVAELGREPGSGLVATADAYILAVRGTILKAADRYRVPIISPYKQFVFEGSLMSYGPDTADIFRRSSSYVDRILKGESAGNLPAQSPNKFELVVNLKTAKALGLSIRESFLLLADEVIE